MSDELIRPEESDCCGSGCKTCIFDIYKERLEKWKIKKDNITESKALSQIKYLPFLITSIQHLSDSLRILQFQSVVLKNSKLKIIHFKQAKLHIDYEIVKEFINIKCGEYLVLKGVFEGEAISRSYTPILNKTSFEEGVFTIIISLLPNGKMSQFFEKLLIGDIVFWRGPYSEFTLNLKSVKNILLFGGGTGIVPLYNVAKTIVEDEESEAWVKVFASFKTTANIILRDEFGYLRDFWNFQMSIYITNESESDFQVRHNESVVYGKINETIIKSEIKKCKNECFVVICGPEAFNHFIRNCFSNFGVQDNNIFVFW